MIFVSFIKIALNFMDVKVLSMNLMPLLILFFMIQNSPVIFKFTNNATISGWSVVNDGVMGGRSQGRFSVNKEGKGLFQGNVSLENNGGFSLVQYRFPAREVSGFKKLVITLKGDGKEYQVRLKRATSDYYSYAYPAQTSGEWETLEIPFNKMVPQFRGNKLNMANFPGDRIEEIAILIGNKKAEEFRLEIDQILLSK
jgi:hypothetical protein